MRDDPVDRAVDGTAARLRRLFEFFATTQCHGRSAVYEMLSHAIASDEALLDLLVDTPDEQRRPSLLFASVNLLLGKRRGESDVADALAAYYPTHGGQRPADAGLVTAFSAFCADHRGEILELLRHGATQTNEIRRCVALRLGLAHVRRHWPGPVALVEVGASAGLNLRFDQYRYRLNGEDVDVGAACAHEAVVVVSSEIRGDGPQTRLLGEMPVVTEARLGIDQSPIDLSDEAARAWLEAFIWPEDVEGLQVLRSAVDLALSTPGIGVVKGDAVTQTAQLLAGLPGDEPVVVFTATLLSYLSAAARTAFVAQLDAVVRAGRRVAWVFCEAPGLLATTDLDIAALNGPVAQKNSLCAVGVSLRSADGGNSGDPGGEVLHADELLALADPYLRWLEPH